MKRQDENTLSEATTSVFKEVTVYIMITRVMVGCGGEGREFFSCNHVIFLRKRLFSDHFTGDLRPVRQLCRTPPGIGLRRAGCYVLN